MNDIAIRVENLGKRYRIGAEEKRPDNLWQATKQLVAGPSTSLGTGPSTTCGASRARRRRRRRSGAEDERTMCYFLDRHAALFIT